MTFLRRLRHLLPSQRRSAERDMAAELESLKEMAGPGELGNLTLAAENAREAFTWMRLEEFGRDLRHALRSILSNRAFSAMAVVSLALGIGANTAIYSFVESILLRSLPVMEPERLVIMKWRTKKSYASTASGGFSYSTGGTHASPDGGMVGTEFPYPALKLFQSNRDLFAAAFAYFNVENFGVGVGERTEFRKGVYVSGDYFRGMGVAAAAGRLIVPSDDENAAPAVVVISYRFGQQHFGDFRKAVNQSIRINNYPVAIVGVAPPEFFGAEPGSTPDIYVPMHTNVLLEPPSQLRSALSARFTEDNFYWIAIMGRLNAGVTLEQAQAVIAPGFRQFVEGTAETEAERTDIPEFMLTEGRTGFDTVRRQYSGSVFVLMAIAASILLIACVNIANLLLARSAARRREIAVRLSIGATRFRIIRQLLTESLLLSAIGGALGVAIASWTINLLTVLLANGRENFTLHAGLNWHVLGIASALSVFTGLLFGLVPAIQATSATVMPALKELRSGGLVEIWPRGWRLLSLSRCLVGFQIAFSLLLLVAAALFGRTLANLNSIKLGFNQENLLLFRIAPGVAGYAGPAVTGVYETLRKRLRDVPGVRAVGLSIRPLPANSGSATVVRIAGVDSGEQKRAGVLSVGPGFFEAMQIPLMAGRDFTGADGQDVPIVAIVNQQFVKTFGMDQPIGRSIVMGRTTLQVVGVVADALYITLKEDYRPMVYLSYLQGTLRGAPSMTFQVRTDGDPLNVVAGIRESIRELDPQLPVSDLKTQQAHIDQFINQEIALARLSAAFSMLALVIACVGLYGMVAFNVTRRTKEFGIRLALGARGKGIVWLVLREVLVLGLAGLAIGMPAVFVLSRFVRSFLYGVPPNDPVSLVFAVVLLLVAGLLAGYVPAHRAARIDPLISLRYE